MLGDHWHPMVGKVGIRRLGVDVTCDPQFAARRSRIEEPRKPQMKKSINDPLILLFMQYRAWISPRMPWH
jgi:hypothetical protein